MYLCLPKGQEKVVRYDDYSSNFTLMNMRYLTPASLDRMLLRGRHLQTGLIRTLFNLAGSRHNLALLFAFGTSTKLILHSNVSPTSSGTIICYFTAYVSHALAVLAVHKVPFWAGLDMGG